MKTLRSYILTLLAIMIAQLCFSQEKICLDFKTKTITVDKKMKYLQPGDHFFLQIDNINMNLYHVSLNKKDSIVSTAVSFPTFDLLGFDAISKIVGNVVNITASSVGQKYDELNQKKQMLLVQQAEIQTEFINAMSEVNQKTSESVAKAKLNSSEFSKSELENLTISESSKADLLNKKNKIVEIDLEIRNIEDQLENLSQSIKAEDRRTQVLVKIANTEKQVELQLEATKPFIDEINSTLTKLNLQALSYLESLDGQPVRPLIESLNKFTLREVFEKLNTLRENVEGYKKTIEKINEDYLVYKKGFIQLYETDTIIKKRDAAYNKISTEATGSLSKELAKISQAKILEYFSSIIHLENNKERSYTSLPFQHVGDISELEITITPKKPEYGQTYKATYQFPQSRISVGIGGAFYYGFQFRNEMYSVREIAATDTTSNFYIVKEEEQKGEIGFATLLHVGGRIKEYVGYNFVIGPALSLAAQPQFRLTLGGGLAFGPSRNKLSINALWMHGYSQRLSNVFQEGEEYSKKPEQITVSKLSQSFGVSLGYIYKF